MKKSLIWCIVLLLVAGLSWHFFSSRLGARWAIDRIADFEVMPADDVELTNWLRAQPGVVPDRIDVFRHDQSLIVSYRIDLGLLGPAVPDLDQKCKALGYAGREGAFHKCPLPILFPNSKDGEYRVPEVDRLKRAKADEGG